MSVLTVTKTGNKATTSAKLDKSVFGVEVKNHELLKQAYVAYLSNSRENLAKTKKRGEVSGGGKKPWRQKGTGRARFGSSRNPIWRGGGIAFGPTGSENYTKKLSTAMKRKAIAQALSLASQENRIIVIENLEFKDGKTAQVAKLLDKIGANKNTLIVTEEKDSVTERATRNIPNLIVTQANYVNVYDVLNADHVVITEKSLPIIEKWLGGSK